MITRRMAILMSQLQKGENSEEILKFLTDFYELSFCRDLDKDTFFEMQSKLKEMLDSLQTFYDLSFDVRFSYFS